MDGVSQDSVVSVRVSHPCWSGPIHAVAAAPAERSNVGDAQLVRLTPLPAARPESRRSHMGIRSRADDNGPQPT